MGSLALPTSGLVYADTSILIYTVETHAAYWPLLRPLWESPKSGGIAVVSSELSVMEALVGPLRAGDAILMKAYDQLFRSPDIRLLPISMSVLREASRLRAAIPSLHAPDALHAATASLAGCQVFLTNDAGFRRVAALPVVVLRDLLTS